MRVLCIGVFCSLVALCSPNPAPAEKPDPVPEVKWARGVGEDFWSACLNGKPEQAAGLLSPELAKAIVTYERWGGVNGELKDVTPGMYVRRETSHYGTETTVSFDAPEVAPDRSEVVFRGSLAGKDVFGKACSARFTMRVAKESAGRWSVRFFQIIERKELVGDKR